MSRLLLSKPARTVLSIWCWFVLGVTLLVLVPVVGLIRLITWRDAGRYKAGLMFRKVAVVHQKLNPLWKFTVSGKVPDDPRRPYVVVANHESFVDILLISHLPFEMKWMSKTEMFKIPFVGWGMRLAGDIELDRSDARAGAHALIESRNRLKNRVSVMIFPEGTRSDNGDLQDFKDGAFRLAVQLGLPILPLAVIGTRDALVKHDWRFGYSEAEVRVLEPIETTGMSKRDAPALRDRTRDRIAEALAVMRAERAV
ncbi:MAG TPA: lysophospholipid acyltransferase family protein [Ilumatobacter sp.]|nr:lysophospholipid acyltransferase family protein [Ilumatobacter sp.]